MEPEKTTVQHQKAASTPSSLAMVGLTPRPLQQPRPSQTETGAVPSTQSPWSHSSNQTPSTHTSAMSNSVSADASTATVPMVAATGGFPRRVPPRKTESDGTVPRQTESNEAAPQPAGGQAGGCGGNGGSSSRVAKDVGGGRGEPREDGWARRPSKRRPWRLLDCAAFPTDQLRTMKRELHHELSGKCWTPGL